MTNQEKKDLIHEKLSVLTPVINKGNVYYKRDDLFTPFDDELLVKTIKNINGTKLRQALSLLCDNLYYIKNECANTIVAHQSATTQQGILITSCANVFDINTVLVVGNIADSSFESNPLIKNAYKLGAKFDRECKIAYNSVLDARVEKLVYEDGYFDFNFVSNMINNFDSIVEPVMQQCQNIPDNVEQVIVPAGNSIIFAAVACGIDKYNKSNVKEVIGIQISGMDRSETVYEIVEKYKQKYNKSQLSCNINFILDKTYPYSKLVNANIGGIELDPVYEAKLYKYMENNIDVTKSTLFWIAGTSEPSRTLNF